MNGPKTGATSTILHCPFTKLVPETQSLLEVPAWRRHDFDRRLTRYNTMIRKTRLYLSNAVLFGRVLGSFPLVKATTVFNETGLAVSPRIFENSFPYIDRDIQSQGIK